MAVGVTLGADVIGVAIAQVPAEPVSLAVQHGRRLHELAGRCFVDEDRSLRAIADRVLENDGIQPGDRSDGAADSKIVARFRLGDETSFLGSDVSIREDVGFPFDNKAQAKVFQSVVFLRCEAEAVFFVCDRGFQFVGWLS